MEIVADKLLRGYEIDGRVLPSVSSCLQPLTDAAHFKAQHRRRWGRYDYATPPPPRDSKSATARGQELHSMAKQWLQDKKEPKRMRRTLEAYWQPLKENLDYINGPHDWIETPLTDELSFCRSGNQSCIWLPGNEGYAGRPDIISRSGGVHILGELKTCASLAHFHKDLAELQVAAYCGAADQLLGLDLTGVIIVATPGKSYWYVIERDQLEARKQEFTALCQKHHRRLQRAIDRENRSKSPCVKIDLISSESAL